MLLSDGIIMLAAPYLDHANSVESDVDTDASFACSFGRPDTIWSAWVKKYKTRNTASC